jgi:hypothetical protein
MVRNVRWTKHPKDHNHIWRGMNGGNGRYCRKSLERLLRGQRVGDLNALKNLTMGKN